MERIRASGCDVLINLTTGPGARFVPGADDPSQPGPGTSLKPPETRVQHILELRQAIDALRIVVGVGAATWTDPVLTTIKAVHITELRARLEEAAGATAFTDPSLAPGFTIKRLHVEELRQRIRAVAGS